MNRFHVTGAALAAIVAMLVPLLSAPPAVSAEDDPVVATVDGAEIHRSRALEERARLPAQMQQVPDDVILPVLVNLVIDTKLLAAEAGRQNLQNDADVRAQMARVEEILLAQVLLNRAIEQQVTDEALEKRYQALVEKTAGEEEIHARHILLKEESEAKAVIDELRKGADFAELAKEKSIGPSAQKGGDLGYFGPDAMVPEFYQAANALKTGAFTEQPVQTQFGWHVIQVEDRRKAEPPPFEEVSDQLRADLMRDARAVYIEGLRENAAIERFDEAAPPAPGTETEHPAK
jgi:peptidyl-prolyl cis-trans isomerase C